jgi:hypothetical protein
LEITQKDRDGVIRTVLTLGAADVVGAEILRDGNVVDYVVDGHRPRGRRIDAVDAIESASAVA